MSSRSSSSKAPWVWIALAIFAGLLASSSHAADPRGSGRSIEFSAPKSNELSTNLNQLTSKKDSLKQLEEDAYKTIQSFTPLGSLDGVTPTAVRPIAPPPGPSKRMKEKMDRDKNYIWMAPEQLLPDKTVEEMLKVPEYDKDGRDKKSMSPMERYYDKLGTKPIMERPDTSVQKDTMNLFGRPGAREESGYDADLPGGLKDSAQALKKMFLDEDDMKLPEAKAAQRSSFNDVFGLGDPMTLREKDRQDQAHKKMMDDFRTGLDPNWRSRGGLDSLQPTDTAFDTAQPKAPAPKIRPSILSQPEATPESILSPIAAATAPTGPKDVNVEALGKYNPAPVPRVELPKQGPPRTAFDFPKRPGL